MKIKHSLPLFKSTACELKSVHVENDHRNSLITLAVNIASLRFFHHSAALHEAVLLIFVLFPYDAHFLSYKNRHSFSIVSTVHFRERRQAYRIAMDCFVNKFVVGP